MPIPVELQKLMGDMWRDIQQSGMKREQEAAEANPQAHKLSRTFGPGVKLNSVYYSAGKDGRGRKVAFFYSTNRNVAGYFLAWRQIEGKKTVKRDQWSARRSKKAISDLCRRRAEAFEARQRARRGA
jgi:hypothetical protein